MTRKQLALPIVVLISFVEMLTGACERQESQGREEVICPDRRITMDGVATRVSSKDGKPYEVITHPQFAGVIFPAESKGNGLSRLRGKDKEAGFWTPTRLDIVLAESSFRSSLEGELKEELQSADPPDAIFIPRKLCQYYRQYVGLLDDRGKKIYVNLFRKDAVQTILNNNRDWETQPIEAYGGGTTFFQARFDVEAGKWQSVFVNDRR